MFCCLSNRVPSEPVVAKTTGYVFERSLIEKYIDENGRCPVSGEPLTRLDLLAVRPSATSPAAASGAASAGLAAVSLPGLLERMRAEWDGLMLEQFSLRQQLAQQQQELAHALHQYEAACRVIARLTKENEDLRRAAGDSTHSARHNDAFDAAMAHAEERQQLARKQLKGKHLDTANYAEEASFTVGAAADEGAVPAGAAGLAVVRNCIFTAELRHHHVLQYSLPERRLVASGAGHSGSVFAVTASADATHVLSAAADGTVKLWQPADSAASASAHAQLLCAQTLRYASGVSALSRRGFDDGFVFSGTPTGQVCVSDVNLGTHLDMTPIGESAGAARAGRAEHHSAVSCVELHPYTKLGAVASEDGRLYIWNVRERAVDTAIALPSHGKSKSAASAAHVCSLDFSADCVTLAAGLGNGSVLVWDLRKVEEPLAVIAPVKAGGSRGSQEGPAQVRFDPSTGSVLAAGGHWVRLWRVHELGSEEAAEPQSFATEGSAVSGLAWGTSFVGAAGVDGVVRIFGES